MPLAVLRRPQDIVGLPDLLAGRKKDPTSNLLHTEPLTRSGTSDVKIDVQCSGRSQQEMDSAQTSQLTKRRKLENRGSGHKFITQNKWAFCEGQPWPPSRMSSKAQMASRATTKMRGQLSKFKTLSLPSTLIKSSVNLEVFGPRTQSPNIESSSNEGELQGLDPPSGTCITPVSQIAMQSSTGDWKNSTGTFLVMESKPSDFKLRGSSTSHDAFQNSDTDGCRNSFLGNQRELRVHNGSTSSTTAKASRNEGTLSLEKDADRIAALIVEKRKANESSMFRQRMLQRQLQHQNSRNTHKSNDNERNIQAQTVSMIPRGIDHSDQYSEDGLAPVTPKVSAFPKVSTVVKSQHSHTRSLFSDQRTSSTLSSRTTASCSVDSDSANIVDDGVREWPVHQVFWSSTTTAQYEAQNAHGSGAKMGTQMDLESPGRPILEASLEGCSYLTQSESWASAPDEYVISSSLSRAESSSHLQPVIWTRRLDQASNSTQFPCASVTPSHRAIESQSRSTNRASHKTKTLHRGQWHLPNPPAEQQSEPAAPALNCRLHLTSPGRADTPKTAGYRSLTAGSTPVGIIQSSLTNWTKRTLSAATVLDVGNPGVASTAFKPRVNMFSNARGTPFPVREVVRQIEMI